MTGRLLEQYLNEKMINLSELCRRLDISRQNMNRKLDSIALSADFLKDVATQLKVPVNELLNYTEGGIVAEEPAGYEVTPKYARDILKQQQEILSVVKEIQQKITPPKKAK